MAEQLIGATCEATFNVSKEGFVETGIEIDCTHPPFIETTRRAIETLRYEPKIVDGKPVRMTNVSYALYYAAISGDVDLSALGIEKPE